MNIKKILMAAFVAAAAWAADDVPLYFLSAAAPFRTIDAQADEEYAAGDLAVAAGRWQPGGTAGGVVMQCLVNEPAADKRGILAAAPVDVRYFYLDIVPPGTPAEGPGEWAAITGLVAEKGLYNYGYVMRPQLYAAAAPPTADESKWREILAALRGKIKKAKLDAITGEPHYQYNRGYKIQADPAAVAFEFQNVDYDHGVAVVRARMERLPPLESDALFRYLDVYLFTDAATGDVRWAVLCVGGFYLE